MISAGEAVAVPSFSTTAPAAKFAKRRRGRDRHLRGERQRQHRDDGVAGAADVEHGARDRRNMLGASPSLPKSDMPAFAARDRARSGTPAAASSARAARSSEASSTIGMPLAIAVSATFGATHVTPAKSAMLAGFGSATTTARAERRFDDVARCNSPFA